MHGLAKPWTLDVASAFVEPTFDVSLLREVGSSCHVMSFLELVLHVLCGGRSMRFVCAPRRYVVSRTIGIATYRFVCAIPGFMVSSQGEPRSG